MEYNGKNSTNPLRYLFAQRGKWYGAFRKEDGSFESDAYIETNIFESVYFQRMNQEFEAVIPKSDFIVQKKINGKNVEGLNFAVDAIEGLITDMKALSFSQINGLTTSDPYLTSPVVYQSYIDPNTLYNIYKGNLMDEYYKFIQTNNYNNSITHFGDFVKYFLYFLKQKGPQYPLTFAGWQKSKRSNCFTSGMAFAIADLDCSDDTQKEQFINSPNFDALKTAAATNGFFIMAGCPWIMLYSPNSSVGMNKYVKTYNNLDELNVSTSSGLFQKYFDTVFLNDINNIKEYYIKYYNIFINNNKYYKKLYIKNNKTIQKVIYRNTTNLNTVNKNFNDSFWLHHYSDLRNFEEYNLLDAAEIERIKQKSSFFQKNIDNSEAISYINDQYKFSHEIKSGGINHYLRNQRKLSED